MLIVNMSELNSRLCIELIQINGTDVLNVGIYPLNVWDIFNKASTINNVNNKIPIYPPFPSSNT